MRSERRFTFQDMVLATGVSYPALQQWFAKKYVYDADEIVAEKGRGKTRTFSFERVIHIAISARLVELGISPSDAYRLAYSFSDTGDGGGGWSGSPAPYPRAREPGALFDLGETYLHVRLPFRGDFTSKLCGPEGFACVSPDDNASHLFVPLAPVVRRVRDRLGIDE